MHDLSGGSVECTTFYMGSTIELQLNDLSSYKITLSFMLFTSSSGQSYTVTFNNDSLSFNASSTSYDVCGTLYIHQQSDINFSDVSINNTLTFSSSQNLYLA